MTRAIEGLHLLFSCAPSGRRGKPVKTMNGDSEGAYTMKIAVMGTGGVGGYFGGLLARAGEDVTFIARGPHLDAIRHKGLRVESDLSGAFTLRSRATDNPGDVGPVDLVLYAVKMYHSQEAIPAIVPLVGKDTVVLPLQNGIDNHHLLGADIGIDHLMIGIAFLQARIKEAGTVEQLGQVAQIIFGEPDGPISSRGRTLLDIFSKAGWNVELSENALGTLWRKFIYLAGSAAVNALTQITYGEMRSIPETRELIRAACQEMINVANASEAPIGDDVLQWCMASLDNFPRNGMSSLANDVRHGRPMELEGLTGAAVRMGREFGVPTPVNTTIYGLLKPAAVKAEEAISAKASQRRASPSA